MKYINKIKINDNIQKSINSNRKTDNINILEYLEQLDKKLNDINNKLDRLLNFKIYL